MAKKPPATSWQLSPRGEDDLRRRDRQDRAVADGLVRAADPALYAAKRAGRNRIVLATQALAAMPSVG